MRSRHPWLSVTFTTSALLAVSAIFGGCAAQRAEKAAPPAYRTAPTPVDDDGAKSSESPAPPAAAPEGAVAPASPPSTSAGGDATGMIVVSPEIAKAQSSFDAATKAFAAAGTDCAQLCKALHSMSNATDRLCDLTHGTADQQRCTDARARLETAKTKVTSTCGSC